MMRISVILLVTIRSLMITNSLRRKCHDFISASTALSVEQLEQELDKLAQDGSLIQN